MNALTIIDDFAPNSEEIRAFALEHDYTSPTIYEGVEYFGYKQPKDKRFTEYYQGIMAARLGFEVVIHGQIFAKLQDGATTPQWIHSDDTCAAFAAVHYLCDIPHQGTQFWKHCKHGVSTLAEWHAAEPLTEQTAQQIRADGQTADAWEKTDYADSKFNRLIYYPANRFHSRASKEGVGQGDECRLTLATFFDLR